MIHEANIEKVLREIGCGVPVFCKLGGISTTRWSRALSGLINLRGSEIAVLNELASELKKLAEVSEPYAVDFKNPEKIKRLLDHRESGIKWRVSPVVENEEV